MKIFLDFGHGGSDTGAVSNGLVEKNMTLTTGLECKAVLEQYGIEVRTSRINDKYVGLSERATMANSWGANYFVSIHYNSGGGDGVEVIHSIFKGKGEALAKSIANTINKETGQNLRSRATYSRVGSDGRDYYAVIRETKMDAVIVECGFIDSADRSLFDTIAEQQKMGRAIAYGILTHLGIAIKPVKVARYWVVTDYIPQTEYGLEVRSMLNKYFYDIDRIYIRDNEKGMWAETQYLPYEKCLELKARLGNLFWEIKED